jgi:hypothetical protein
MLLLRGATVVAMVQAADLCMANSKILRKLAICHAHVLKREHTSARENMRTTLAVLKSVRS